MRDPPSVANGLPAALPLVAQAASPAVGMSAPEFQAMLNQLLVQQKSQTQSLLQPLLSRLDNLEGQGYKSSSDIDIDSGDEEEELIAVIENPEGGGSRRSKRAGRATASEIIAKVART